MIDKNIYDKRKYKKLNGNVIELPISDEVWKIKDDEDKENGSGDKESKKKIIKRLASYDPLIDDLIMAAEYWQDQWENHPYKNRFKNANEFMKWSLSQEDQPTFNRGGSVKNPKGILATLTPSQHYNLLLAGKLR